jgi:predicted TIM-barrel fold metal-dependent hydrolase
MHDQLGLGHYPVQLMAELGQRFPDTTFIFAHVGMMWVKALQAVKPYPNLLVDVSGFDPERGIVEKAVEILGAERVLFGSDAPGRAYAAQLAKVQYADISERDKALLLGGNAARLLGLGTET